MTMPSNQKTSDFKSSEMVLYIDEDLLIINKPSGLLSIQDGYDRNLPHLLTILEPEFGKLWVIHRLDKETSGVVILGRNAETHRYFNQLFQSREIIKIYHCLIIGSPSWNNYQANYPLLVNADRLHRTLVNPLKGKPALTSLSVLERLDELTLLECQLFTGYTHQIRAHLFYLGYPILGDSLYCPSKDRKKASTNYGLNRIALHAFLISFAHPTMNKELTVTAPYPTDLDLLIKHLRSEPQPRVSFPD